MYVPSTLLEIAVVLAAVQIAHGSILYHRDAPSSVDKSQINNCLDPYNSEQGQKIQACPPKNTLDKHGDCGPLKPYGKNGLLQAAFCQIDVSWSYGKESPLGHGVCGCSDACALADGTSTSVTNGFSFNIGGQLKKREEGLKGLGLSDLTSIFNAGATWSYSTTFTSSKSTTHTRPAFQNGKCGYWTFVPYMVTVCGTISWKTAGYNAAGYWESSVQTQKDWCQTTAYTDDHGAPLGETIFVTVRCPSDHQSHTILPFCWQESLYLEEGVSTNETVHADYVKAHQDFDINKPMSPTSVPSIMCQKNLPPYEQGDIGNGCTTSSSAPAGPTPTSGH